MCLRKYLAIALVITAFGLAGCTNEKPSTSIDPKDFVPSVDNPFFPLVPGTVTKFKAKTAEGIELQEVEVTKDTRTILGVKCTVVKDTVKLNGELIEDTFDWYAQDKDGNVWYFGEDSKDFEEGEFVSSKGSWEAGKDGAEAGIIMKADPKVGDKYRQEFYKDVAEDMGEVLELDASESVPYGSFDALLVTRDWTPLEPGVEEHKYYAKGIGAILEIPVDAPQERNELISVKAPTGNSTSNN